MSSSRCAYWYPTGLLRKPFLQDSIWKASPPAPRSIHPSGCKWHQTGAFFVAEKSGLVYVVENGVKLTTPFIDLRTEVRRSMNGVDQRGSNRVDRNRQLGADQETVLRARALGVVTPYVLILIRDGKKKPVAPRGGFFCSNSARITIAVFSTNFPCSGSANVFLVKVFCFLSRVRRYLMTA